MSKDKDTTKYLDKAANKAFENLWKELKDKKMLPDSFFSEQNVKYMFGVVFFSGYESGWNECVVKEFKDSMKEIEFAMSELVEVVTHLKKMN